MRIDDIVIPKEYDLHFGGKVFRVTALRIGTPQEDSKRKVLVKVHPQQNREVWIQGMRLREITNVE